MSTERLIIVAYDIRSPKRWRRIFKLMKGYGEWLQLSIFQCRLSPRRRAELQFALDNIINHKQDHVIMLDLGDADKVNPKVSSLGKEFTPIAREAIIV